MEQIVDTAEFSHRLEGTNLIFEITVLAARYGVIENVEITRELVAITKGVGTLPEGGINLDGLLRNKKMTQL